MFVEISAGHAVGLLDAFGIVPLALGLLSDRASGQRGPRPASH